MIDLHIHFPMRLLGGVEAPRDVIEGMTRVRGREDGKLRAAVLAIAARLFNFRDWDGDLARRRRSCSSSGERERRLQRALPAVQRDGPRRALRARRPRARTTRS